MQGSRKIEKMKWMSSRVLHREGSSLPIDIFRRREVFDDLEGPFQTSIGVQSIGVVIESVRGSFAESFSLRLISWTRNGPQWLFSAHFGHLESKVASLEKIDMTFVAFRCCPDSP